MAFKLDLEFTERLYLSDVSRQSVVRASTVYFKAFLVLSSFCKRRAQQITAYIQVLRVKTLNNP